MSQTTEDSEEEQEPTSRKYLPLIIALIISLVLWTLSIRLIFPELTNELTAGDYRALIITIVAWVAIFIIILLAAHVAIDSARNEDGFKPLLIPILTSLFCYLWMSLATEKVEEVYYSWAYDSSYSEVTYSDKYGRTVMNISGETDRMIKQLPVTILGPNGLRVSACVVVTFFALGLSLVMFDD